MLHASHTGWFRFRFPWILIIIIFVFLLYFEVRLFPKMQKKNVLASSAVAIIYVPSVVCEVEERVACGMVARQAQRELFIQEFKTYPQPRLKVVSVLFSLC